MNTPDPIRCSGGCKREVTDEKAAQTAGWSYLHITGRYRCGSCEGELIRASDIVGTPSEFKPDPLPPTSIGALKQLPKPLELHEKVKP